MLSPEDDLADTIRPRLHAAGADLDRIVSLTIPSPQHALAALDQLLDENFDHRLLIIDPLTLCIRAAPQAGTLVNSLLSPIADFAERHNVAVLAVAPVDRAAGTRSYFRAIGAREYSAARAAFALTRDHDNPHRRILHAAKNNLAPLSPNLAFTIDTSPDILPVLNWSVPSNNSRQIQSSTDRAVILLRTQLAAGPVPASDIRTAARQARISSKTLFRAKRLLGITASRSGFADGLWVWSVPSTSGGGPSGPPNEHTLILKTP